MHIDFTVKGTASWFEVSSLKSDWLVFLKKSFILLPLWTPKSRQTATFQTAVEAASELCMNRRLPAGEDCGLSTCFLRASSSGSDGWRFPVSQTGNDEWTAIQAAAVKYGVSLLAPARGGEVMIPHLTVDLLFFKNDNGHTGNATRFTSWRLREFCVRFLVLVWTRRIRPLMLLLMLLLLCFIGLFWLKKATTQGFLYDAIFYNMSVCSKRQDFLLAWPCSAFPGP